VEKRERERRHVQYFSTREIPLKMNPCSNNGPPPANSLPVRPPCHPPGHPSSPEQLAPEKEKKIENIKEKY